MGGGSAHTDRGGIGNALPEVPASLPSSVLNTNVDQILSLMSSAHYAFNVPQKMKVKESAYIELKLSLNKSIAQLKDSIEANGKIESGKVKVSDRMRAQLISDKEVIEVIPLSTEEQAIDSFEMVHWKWKLVPKSAGKHTIDLQLIAIMNVNGKDVPRLFKTLNETIEVEVTYSHLIESFYDENWKWVWATFLLPFIGWTWNRWKPKTI